MTPTLSVEAAASPAEYWSPHGVAGLSDSYVKASEVPGSLARHSHAHEDELFYVLKSQPRTELEQGTVELVEGGLYVVPKGIRHNPVAEQECHIMLVEKKATGHPGSAVVEKTRSLAYQIEPL